MNKIVFILMCFFLKIHAQPNCKAFLHEGDSLKYRACKLVEKLTGSYYQFSKEYQKGMDEALLICPYFAYAYREKSSAYVKSGDFLNWKKLIDLAVKYEPLDYLSVRASLRYKFFSDYKGAILDIEKLDDMVSYDIGETSNGTYHLNVVKALCYKEIGQKQKAIKILEKQIENESYIGVYDYLHLGVLYLETEMYDNAIIAFEKQEKLNDLAENHYYLALVFKKLGLSKKYIQQLVIAEKFYLDRKKMHDSYNQLIDQIYLEEIKSERSIANNK